MKDKIDQYLRFKRLSDEGLTQHLIPERFIPEKPPELEGKDVVYIFDSEDSFNLTYDELVEIVRQARLYGPGSIPVLGTVS